MGYTLKAYNYAREQASNLRSFVNPWGIPSRLIASTTPNDIDRLSGALQRADRRLMSAPVIGSLRWEAWMYNNRYDLLTGKSTSTESLPYILLPCGGIGERLSMTPKQALPTAFGYTVPWMIRQQLLEMGIPASHIIYGSTKRFEAIAEVERGQGAWQDFLFGKDIPIDPNNVVTTDYAHNDSGAVIGLLAKVPAGRPFIFLPADHNFSVGGLRNYIQACLDNAEQQPVLAVTRKTADEMLRFGSVITDIRTGNPVATIEKTPLPVSNLVNCFDLAGPVDSIYNMARLWEGFDRPLIESQGGFVKTFFTHMMEQHLANPNNPPVLLHYFSPTEWQDVGQPDQWLSMVQSQLHYKEGYMPRRDVREIMPGIFIIKTGKSWNNSFLRQVRKMVESGSIVGPVSLTDNIRLGKGARIESSALYGPMSVEGPVRGSHVVELLPGNMPRISDIENAFVNARCEKDISSIHNGALEGRNNLDLNSTTGSVHKLRTASKNGPQDVEKRDKSKKAPDKKTLPADYTRANILQNTSVIDFKTGNRPPSFFETDENAQVIINGTPAQGPRYGFAHVSTATNARDLVCLFRDRGNTLEPLNNNGTPIRSWGTNRRVYSSRGIYSNNPVLLAFEVGNIQQLTATEEKKIQDAIKLAGVHSKQVFSVVYTQQQNNPAPVIRQYPLGRNFDPNNIEFGTFDKSATITRRGSTSDIASAAIDQLVNWILSTRGA